MVALKQTKQLTLPVQLPSSAQFSYFVAGSNAAAVEYLATPRGEAGFAHTAVYGGKGVGKTHLLCAVTEQANTEGLVSMYVPMRDAVLQGHPQLLEGLENCHVLALDDIHEAAHSKEWNLALFALINRFIDKRSGHLVWSASESAHQLPMQLADLRSRLQAATAFVIHPLQDNDKQLALRQHAQSRGLVLSGEVADYMLSRLPRTMPSLIGTLEQLDAASMREQRRLTVPFVKQVLGL